MEVINNPGARYAASVKAVIRIQTRKAAGDGLGFNNQPSQYPQRKPDGTLPLQSGKEYV